LLVTEWSTAQGGVNGALTKEEIRKFRKGDYNGASDEIKEKWCFVMLNFMPLVSPKYTKKDVKKTIPISECTHASDEALVLWLLYCYIDEWDSEIDDDNDGTTTRKCTNKRGKHFSRTNLAEFLEILERITMSRNDPITGKGWDEPVKEEATRLSAVEGDEENNRETMNEPLILPENRSTKKLVMPFSIGKQTDQRPQIVVTNTAAV
jgi:hypothetical protein